ncbi:MAG TPA: TonB family protein [Verrucomicrobiae bacterium]|nr:TonB family protein [Verrucomicrobiae bacterium]
MNRLQKKCFLAAAGLHLLLIGILIVGPAFLSPNDKTLDVPVIDFVPIKTVDAAISGGGNPKAAPPAKQEPAPAPAPPVRQPDPVVRQPDPIPEPNPVRRVEPKPDPAPKPVEKAESPKDDSPSEKPVAKPRHKIIVSTTPVKRDSADSHSAEKARAEARARAAAEQRRIAENFSKRIAGIRGGLSESTEIEYNGPGGGGPSYANFYAAVKKKYSDAWTVPDGVTDDSATVAASVTIARDGSVISARIIRSSGNSLVDDSVQRTLDRVKFAAPLPDDAKESQRTVTINFNVKAKLLG